MRDVIRKLTPVLIIAEAAALYAVCRRAYYVGFFNDDAFFIIGAKSLLKFCYVDLGRPGWPPHTIHPPGFPLMLAPVVMLFPENLTALQVFSMLLMIGGAIFFTLSFTAYFSSGTRLLFIAALLFNPLLASLSGTVLSDIALFFVVGIILFLVSRWNEEWSWRELVTLAILSAYCFYVRHNGATFVLAAAGVLLMRKKWKNAAMFVMVCVLIIAPYLIRNFLASGRALPLAAEYTSHYFLSISPLEIARQWMVHATFYMREMWIQQFFRWPNAIGGKPLEWVTIAICSIFCLIGMRSIKNKSVKRLCVFSLVIFFVVLCGWDKHASRYLLPIFPILIGCALIGAEKIAHGTRFERLWRPIVAGLLSLCYAPTLHRIVRTSLYLHTPVNTPTEATFDWVRRNTAPGDVFAAEWDGQFFLHTNRQVFHTPQMPDPVVFQQWARSNNVKFLLISPVDFAFLTQSGNKAYEPFHGDDLNRLVAHRELFKLVYENKDERTFIYEIS